MKKKIFLLISILSICHIQAVSKNDIDRQLATAINNINAEALESFNSITRQQQVVTLWDDAVAKAKNFVKDNSTDLLKKVDPKLMQDISEIDNLNNDFINTIKVIRGAAKAPISRLLQVSNNAKNVINQFQQQSFTLSSKKDALYILTRIATFISQSSKELYDKLFKKSNIAQ